MTALYVLCDVCDFFLGGSSPDPNIVFSFRDSLTPEEQVLLRSGLCKIGCERCNHCVDESRVNIEPRQLWTETETKLRKDLSRWVQLKAEYRTRKSWHDSRKRLRLKVRALVHEILSLRNPDNGKLAAPPAAKTEKGEGNGGADSTPPAADTPPRKGNGVKGNKPKRRKKRSDPKDDKRVADAYVAGGYQTETACATALSMTVNDVHRARDRHRKRQAAKERGRNKPRQ